MHILLASTSTYRRVLLARLGLTFECTAPGTDETPQANELSAALVARLAKAKAVAVARRYPDSLVIGADQVAELGGEILGKPGDHARAVRQLTLLSGNAVTFHTALCVQQTATGRQFAHVDTTRVYFRQLSAQEIERYLRAEQPYECAGSFKSESLGISLFERIESQDPTALMGLPLIALCRFLRELGVRLP
ncbi:MAG: Maf family protein [Gammaproteobacteria bacterium]